MNTTELLREASAALRCCAQHDVSDTTRVADEIDAAIARTNPSVKESLTAQQPAVQADHFANADKMVQCQCGDTYPEGSYQARFIAGRGKCENCAAGDGESLEQPAAPAVPADVECDASRFRWLCEDHADRETRDRVRSICESMSCRGIGSTRANIDANMIAAAPKVK